MGQANFRIGNEYLGRVTESQFTKQAISYTMTVSFSIPIIRRGFQDAG